MLQVTSPSLVSEVMGMPPITTPTYAKEFKKVIEAAARGRQIFTVQVSILIFFLYVSIPIKRSIYSINSFMLSKLAFERRP